MECELNWREGAPDSAGLPKEMQFVDEPYWPFIGEKSKVDVLASSDEMIHRGDDAGLGDDKWRRFRFLDV